MNENDDDFSNYRAFPFQILGYNSKEQTYILFDRNTKQTVTKSKKEYWELLDEFKKKK